MAVVVSLLLELGFLLLVLMSADHRVNVTCSDDGGGNNINSNGDMVQEELFGLFEVMGSLLEDPNWAQTYPLPCTDTPWPGVECELQQETSTFHVTKIHLGPDIVTPPCKASAKISDSILSLPYLKSLSLTSCFTESPVSLSKSTVFGSLSYLEHLTLASNPSLSGEIPSRLSNLTTLETLCLSQNNLSGSIPSEIFKLLVNLKELDLSHNALTGSIPKEIECLKKLTILDMSWNHLQEMVPSAITRLQFLEKMDLSYNELRGSLPQDLGKLRRLALLDMSHNHLTGPFPRNLTGLQQLQYLIMDENPLNTSFPSSSLESLAQITVLSFSGCGLKGPITASFSNLTKLNALSLDNNSLNGSVPQELGLLQNLDTLNLSRNQFSGDLLFPQEFIDRLGQRLDVRENSGLCAIQVMMENGQNSRFLQNPSCSGSLFPGYKNKTASIEDQNQDRSKALYNGNMTSSNGGGRMCDGLMISLLCPVLVILLLMYSIN